MARVTASAGVASLFAKMARAFRLLRSTVAGEAERDDIMSVRLSVAL